MSSKDLMFPDDTLTEDDQHLWSNLLDTVNTEESNKKSSESEVAPKPAFCVKTKNKEGVKVFLNICTVDSIPEPKKLSIEDLGKMLESEDEMARTDYRIPMSIGEKPHAEVDKKAVGCSVYDIAINPKYVLILRDEPAFLNFFLQVVFEGIMSKFEIELSWDWNVLKNRSHVGRIKPHRIRTFKRPVIQEVPKEDTDRKKKSTKPTVAAPKPDYILLKEPIEGTPDYLIAEIWLPGIESSAKLTLDVGEDRITLHAHPAKYFLDVELPYDVIKLESRAHYDTENQMLTVVLRTALSMDLSDKLMFDKNKIVLKK